MPEPYISVDQVRDKLPDGTSYTDDQIQNAIDLAEALIKGRSGKTFGQVNSQTIYDVRTDNVVLPLTGAITDVIVHDISIPMESLQIMPWGVRFLAPPGGVWYHPSRPLAYEPIRSWWTTGRGVTVTVTGTFGEEVSPLIRKAAILLAIQELGVTTTETTSVLDGIDLGELQSLSVEGLSFTLRAGAKDEAGSISTGSRAADRLIDLALGSVPFIV